MVHNSGCFRFQDIPGDLRKHIPFTFWSVLGMAGPYASQCLNPDMMGPVNCACDPCHFQVSAHEPTRCRSVKIIQPFSNSYPFYILKQYIIES